MPSVYEMTSGHGRRLLGPAELEEALREVQGLARASGVRIALAGGFALQRLGSPRLTADLDVVASGPIEGLPAEKQLSFGGYSSTAPNGVPTDVILRRDKARAIYEDALATAKSGAVGLVVSPEHLVVMKMVAGRDKNEIDLGFLLTSPGVDKERARALVERFLGWYGADEFDSFLAESEWKASRGKIDRG